MEAKQTSLFFSKWVFRLLGAKTNYRLRYFHQRGHFPNLKHPKDISEILISHMFTPMMCVKYAPFVDKLALRDYVKWKGMDHILLNHYGVWSRPGDVEFDKLPKKFVLKSNNGCGHHIICRDKDTIDQGFAIEEMRRAIKSGVTNVEPHYHFITPRVFAEELIETVDDSLPVDYKFTCIDGEILDIFVATDRAITAHYCTLDINWKPLPYTKKEFLPNHLPEKPEHLPELIKVAQKLSEGFGFVRVDLYEYKGQPFISELTFFPWGALFYSYTDEAIRLYGEKWHEWDRRQNKNDYKG